MNLYNYNYYIGDRGKTLSPAVENVMNDIIIIIPLFDSEYRSIVYLYTLPML